MLIAILRILLIAVEVIVSILLIGIILIQKSKDEGLGIAFGSGMGETLFGSRAGSVVTKITIWLAVIFLVNTTLLGIVYTKGTKTSLVERAVERAAPAPVEAPAPLENAQPMATGPQGGSTPGAVVPSAGQEAPASAAPDVAAPVPAPAP